MNSFYQDDALVGQVTRSVLSQGIRVLQIFQHGSEREHVEHLLEKFNPPYGAVVLDVGCGVGEVSRLMKEMRPDLHPILLNVSPSQLELCPPFPKMCCDVNEGIPLPDSFVDAVMACYVLGHLDKDHALSEMRRVLRPGGVLFIVDISGGEIEELGYHAHDIGGEPAESFTTNVFDRLLPDFPRRRPDVRPYTFREVKDG